MKNFVRIIPKQGFENWPTKLSKMDDLFDRSKIEMVKQKFQDAFFVNVNPNNLEERIEEFEKNELNFTFLNKTAYSQNLAQIYSLPRQDEPFLWHGVLTRNQKDGKRFKSAELKGDYKTIGQMLGHPKCCIDYFIKKSSVNFDPIWVDLEGKVNGYAECNQMLRYFGARITSHLSCSPDCKPTKEIGEKWFGIMKQIDKKLAQELYNLLSSDMVWNSYHGIAQIDTPYFLALANTFTYLENPRIIEYKGVLLNKKVVLFKKSKSQKKKSKKK